jgi:hypothetical protein
VAALSGAASGISTRKTISRCEALSERGRMSPLAGLLGQIFLNAAFLPRLRHGLNDRARFTGLQLGVRTTAATRCAKCLQNGQGITVREVAANVLGYLPEAGQGSNRGARWMADSRR